jgi:hypothetical protein
MRMRIYADQRYLPEGLPHCPMLYPFWGLRSKAVDIVDATLYDHYLKSGPFFFEPTALKEAQIAILPFEWEQIVPQAIKKRFDLEHHGKSEKVVLRGISHARQLAEELAAAAANENKPLAIFFVDDNETVIPFDNCFTFRASLRSSLRKPHEFAMPIWMRDEVEASCGGELPLRPKRTRPVVGFDGFPGRGALGRAFGLLVDKPYRTRARALHLLSQSAAIKTNFVFRTDWFNGVFKVGVDSKSLETSRQEFFRNMFESDYILCTRGWGNYSIRFYETLSCGRIPIFINTDCVLPFEQYIDWKQYCVWVDEKDLPHLPERVMEFHERLSPQGFEDLQRACRQLSLDWLSPEGFFRNFHRHFTGL